MNPVAAIRQWLSRLLKPPSREEILSGPPLRTMARIGVPAAFGTLLFTLYNLANAYWVGKLPPEASGSALAGIQVSWPIVWLLIAFVIGFGGASVAALVSQYTGANRLKEANLAFNQFAALAMVTGVVLGVVGYLISPWFLRILVHDPSIADAASSYLEIIFLGLPTMILPGLFFSTLSATGDTLAAVVVNGAGALLNVGLDAVFVLGWGPVPRMGIVGAAYATVICQGLVTIAFFILFAKGRGFLRLRLEDLRPRWEWMKRGLEIGLPAGVGQTATAFGFTIMTAVIARLPNPQATLAGYGVGDRLLGLLFIATEGLSIGLTTMVGQALGAGLLDRTRELLKKGLAGLMAILAVEAVFLVTLRYTLLGFFAPGRPDVVEIGADFVQAFGLSLPFLGIFFATIAVYRAAGRNRPAMYLELARLWGLRVPLSWALAYPLHLGAGGVWWGMSASNAVSGLLAIVALTRPGWRRVVIEPVPEEVRTPAEP